MVPIVLFLFDIAVLVLGNTANDNLAKQAARAAASAVTSSNTGSGTVAQTAAQTVINQFATSGFINAVAFSYIYYDGQSPSDPSLGVGVYQNAPSASGWSAAPAIAQQDPGPGNVAIVTAMNVQPPVPFPIIGGQRIFFARAVEPIVSISP